MEDQNNFARVTSKQKKPISRLDLGKTSYNGFVSVRSEFLRLVEGTNKFLRLVTIYNMFKYIFGIKTTLLESHRNQKSPLKARFQ